MPQSCEKHWQAGAGSRRAYSPGEEARRATKTQLFKWQAKTALACLVIRTMLLHRYVMYAFDAWRQGPKWNNLADMVAWIYIATEVALSAYRLFFNHLQALRYCPKAKYRPRLFVDGHDVPTVDVMIFYCGEELAVLLDTVRAACSLDYPKDRFRVVVLDDSASVSQQVQALNYPNLFYSARPREARAAWHKAGNINYGLRRTAALPPGPSELVAGLDTDMLPTRDWLRRLAPHLQRDPRAGLASPNQTFYNALPGDPLCQLLQFHHTQGVWALRQEFGGRGLGAGTGWLARRAALDAIGGFAAAGIAEDYLTCVRLRRAGWVVAALDEDLQWGLVPDSLGGHLRQQQRWARAMLSFYQEARAGRHASSTRATWPAWRPSAEVTMLVYVIGMMLCYAGLPLMVLSGQPLVRVADQAQLRTLLILAFADYLAHTAHGFLESATTDFRIYAWHDTSHMWHTPIYVSPVLQRFFPRLAKRISAASAVLAPAGSAANRSSENQYTSPWKRLRVLCQECRYMALHGLVLAACIAGAVRLAMEARRQVATDVGWRAGFEFVVTRAGWPPAWFLWTSAAKNACIPFSYALLGRPRKDRECDLVRNEDGAAYPTAEANARGQHKVNEGHLILTLAYFGVVIWAMSQL